MGLSGLPLLPRGAPSRVPALMCSWALASLHSLACPPQPRPSVRPPRAIPWSKAPGCPSFASLLTLWGGGGCPKGQAPGSPAWLLEGNRGWGRRAARLARLLCGDSVVLGHGLSVRELQPELGLRLRAEETGPIHLRPVLPRGVPVWRLLWCPPAQRELQVPGQEGGAHRRHLFQRHHCCSCCRVIVILSALPQRVPCTGPSGRPRPQASLCPLCALGCVFAPPAPSALDVILLAPGRRGPGWGAKKRGCLTAGPRSREGARRAGRCALPALVVLLARSFLLLGLGFPPSPGE